MADLCDDGRFELIEKYKLMLMESTNISDSEDELKVLDTILFRFWQMGWLDKLEQQTAQQWIPCSEMEPKESGYYLCTHGGSGFVGLDYYTTQEQAEELFADPEDEYLDLEEYIGWTSKNVIAWMHRPEPWEGEP